MTEGATRDAGTRRGRFSRRTVILVAAAVAVVVAVVVTVLVTRGPSSPGDVTFSVGGADVTTGPAQWCDVTVSDCDDDPDALARAAVPPGTPLRVTVPAAVAATPWQVVFGFRDASGAEQRGRSPVFPPNGPADYTLTLPDPTDRLETAEVQQYGARITQGADGLEFATRATWVLAVPPS